MTPTVSQWPFLPSVQPIPTPTLSPSIFSKPPEWLFRSLNHISLSGSNILLWTTCKSEQWPGVPCDLSLAVMLTRFRLRSLVCFSCYSSNTPYTLESQSLCVWCSFCRNVLCSIFTGPVLLHLDPRSDVAFLPAIAHITLSSPLTAFQLALSV